MLTRKPEFVTIAEVNPPQLPDMTHLRLDGAWGHIIVTDNVFGKIRVSPYAFAARITHDLASVHPTVVVSTRDRNILAIESEVRGALGNGIDSFFVVVGDTYPATDHQADHFEVVEHLRALQGMMPAFEVGMPTRFKRWHLQRRIDLGAQFFVAGPLLDPDQVEAHAGALALSRDDPPVFLSVIPPFSLAWVERAEHFGAIRVGDEMRRNLASIEAPEQRSFGWAAARRLGERAAQAGFAGLVLMGLRFETVVDEAHRVLGIDRPIRSPTQN
jgi:5,10-methylenetetrahydrofolate reductase